MTAIAFDTLKAVKNLKAAGVDEAQAEAFVETVGSAINDNVATKTDLRELEQRMTIKLGTLIVAGVGFLALLDRLFPVVSP